MTTTQAEATVESLQAELAQVRRERLEERQQIVEVARKAAADNGMCDVVDRALTRAGLLGGEPMTVKASVPIQIVLYADNGADEASVQALLNAHVESIGTAVVSRLGHIRALSNGNVRNRDAQLTLDGEIQIVAMTPGAPRQNNRGQIVDAGVTTNGAVASNAWANAPQGYLALYTTPYGRTVHFVAALPLGSPRAYRVRVAGVDWEVARTPLCHTSGVRGWQEYSIRSENAGRTLGVCTECRARATRQYRWRGVTNA